MKKIHLLPTLFLSLATSFMTGCSDWTDVEAEVFPEDITSEEYYEALREYKRSDHQLAFGWFGGWSGEGAFMKKSLAGIPDSVDIISIWDNGLGLSDAQKRDMQFVQQVKGTKVVFCRILKNVGDGFTPAYVGEGLDQNGQEYRNAVNEFWGFPSDESDQAAVESAIRKYARAVVDTLNVYGYDGFDIDYEPTAGPHVGNLIKRGSGGNYANNENFAIFLDELGKYLGPKSGTGKLLLIDGEPQSMTDRPELGVYFDYFVIQAYSSGSDTRLDGRLLGGSGAYNCGLVETFGEVLGEEKVTNMTIMTENFEAVDVAMNGGYDYTDRWGNSMKSLEGFARWQPRNGFRKAGVGTYHMEAEYGTNPEYKNLRNAIQIMNPSGHSLLKK